MNQLFLGSLSAAQKKIVTKKESLSEKETNIRTTEQLYNRTIVALVAQVAQVAQVAIVAIVAIVPIVAIVVDVAVVVFFFLLNKTRAIFAR